MVYCYSLNTQYWDIAGIVTSTPFNMAIGKAQFEMKGKKIRTTHQVIIIKKRPDMIMSDI